MVMLLCSIPFMMRLFHAEFEVREADLKVVYVKDLDRLTPDFNTRLAVKQNEINAFKGTDDENGGMPTTFCLIFWTRLLSTEARLKCQNNRRQAFSNRL